MKFKEVALFWISNEYMYGALGMLGKIPPKSDIVARIQVAKVFDKFDNELKPKPDHFTATMNEVKRLYGKAKIAFTDRNHSSAVTIYNKSVYMLENLRLANENQELEVKEQLSKIYLNLGICYNKLNLPKKSCIAMRDFERVASINGNPKALYTKGNALMMLDDLNSAEKWLEKARKITPGHLRINSKLQEIQKIRKSRDNYEAMIKAAKDELKVSGCDNDNDLGENGYYVSSIVEVVK